MGIEHLQCSPLASQSSSKIPWLGQPDMILIRGRGLLIRDATNCREAWPVTARMHPQADKHAESLNERR
jgi:hypothetical protein